MRIETLTLERYGIFTDRVLSFRPDAPLHVVLGANEAGKTSALSAIGDLLFGFGARTDYDFRHDSKTLRIGGAFRHADGRTLSVRRRKGNKNTLVDAADQPLPDTTLEPFLAGITRDILPASSASPRKRCDLAAMSCCMPAAASRKPSRRDRPA